MSNCILVDTMLIVSSVILITEISLLITDFKDSKDLQDNHASAQILSISTLGLLAALTGMFLRSKIESKEQKNYTLAALMYIVADITGKFTSRVV